MPLPEAADVAGQNQPDPKVDAVDHPPFAQPPKLFSHNDQQSGWQASNPEGALSG